MKKIFTLIALCYVGLSNAQVPTTGLVAEWKFTDGTITDSITMLSGSAQLGAVPTIDRFGNADDAYDLPPGGYLTFGDLYDTYITGANSAFSYSLWVKFDEINSTYHYIIGKAAFESICSLAGRQFVIGVNTNNRIEAQLFGALTGGHKKFQSSGTVSAGAWTHVVVGVAVNSLVANPNSVPVMYINGVAQTVTSNETAGGGLTANGMDNGSAFFSAGRYNNNQGNPCATTQYLDGQFDDLRVYNRMLGSEEVTALYNEAAPVGCPQAVITSEPASSVGICEGSTTATISVAVAEQTTNIQWQNFVSDWVDMTGEVGSDLVISLAGYYRAKLTTDCGTVSYSAECSAAGNGPVITSPLPTDLYICPSVGYRELSVEAVGSGITYQWQSSPGNPSNMADILGATESTYNATEGATYYQVVVSACGVDQTSTYVIVNDGFDNSATIFGGNTSICLGSSLMLASQVAQNSVLDWQPGGMTSPNVTVSPTETTTYTFTATSTTFGCTASATTTITVIDPQPEIIDNMGTLEVTGGSFNGFQWYLENGDHLHCDGERWHLRWHFCCAHIQWNCDRNRGR
jgi:hypothetical protein